MAERMEQQPGDRTAPAALQTPEFSDAPDRPESIASSEVTAVVERGSRDDLPSAEDAGAAEDGDSHQVQDLDDPKRPTDITERDEPKEVAARIEEIPAPDGASVLESLSSGAAANVAEYLDPETASRIMAEMDPTLAGSVLSDMQAAEASMVLAAMDPDDAVDVLGHVPKVKHDEILEEMAVREATAVRTLEQYAPDTAGGTMTTEVTALDEDLTVQQAVDELRRLNEQLEQMFYVYVVDERKHLVGVLSMRDLILARPDRKLAKVMNPRVKSVPTTMDREQVARLFRRFNYLAMPVVDERNRLVGLITVDDVVRVLDEETTEDVQKLFGAGADERLTSPWSFSFRKRIFWLQVNLGTAFLAAGVIGLFDTTIAALPILAGLQTIVSGMGGNASAQAMAVAVRGIAMGEVDKRVLRRVLRRELIVGLLSGLTIGLTTCLVVILFYGNVPVALIIALALLVNHVNACVSGVAIPFVMKKLGFDPAQSATIFATTLTDCGGFFVSLWLAKVLLHA